MSRKILLLLGFISLIGAGYFFSLQNDAPNEPEVISKQEQVELELNEPQVELIIDDIIPKKNGDETHSNEVAITEEEIADLQEWQDKRGYPRLVLDENSARFEAVDYDSYESNTLKELANNNDPKAMMALSERLLNKGELELAKPLLIQASVLGYTKSIIDLGIIYQSQFNMGKDKGNKEHILQAIAWYQVALKRGDINAEAPLQLVKIQNPDLNEDDYAEINALAVELYSSLAEARKKMGLEDFDNSTPSALYKL